MRRVILNELENTTLEFTKRCLEHDNEIRQKKRRTPSAKCRGGNMADAKKVLEKVLKIIPDSEEIREMVGEYGGSRCSASYGINNGETETMILCTTYPDFSY